MATATPSVTIAAMVSGALHRVNLIKTGPTSISAQTLVWNSGSNPDGPADSSSVSALSNCKASADGQLLTADAPPVGWLHPSLGLTLAITADGYSADIKVTNASFWNSDTLSPISQDDYEGAVAFVKDCAFPLPA